LKEKKGNAIVPDTNILLDDKDVIKKLINKVNLVILPGTVLVELDELKNKANIGLEARRVAREIDELVKEENPNFVIDFSMRFEDMPLSLQKEVRDVQIAATFSYVINNHDIYGGYQKYKLISNDINMRSIAHGLFKGIDKVSIESYQANQIDTKKSHKLVSKTLPNVNFRTDYNEGDYGDIQQNGGVVVKLTSQNEGMGGDYEVLAVRKGDKLEIIPNDLKLYGLKASHEGRVNYGQLLAFYQLVDPGVQCVFLSGPAGTGKTLIAIAAALQQKSDFKQFLITNPMVALSNNDKMGFLPGDLKDKIAPWLQPFNQNLRFLESLNDIKKNGASTLSKKAKAKASKDEPEAKTFVNLWEKYGFVCQPLGFIRGQSFPDAFIIIDEAQNLSQHEMKTIVTRAGKGSKLVFCGDLSQIDVSYLSARTSGLTYAIEKISGTGRKSMMVGVTLLTETVRSKLAAFASEVM
jgi:PhoH-like ATPase